MPKPKDNAFVANFLWRYAQLRNRHLLCMDAIAFLIAPTLAFAIRLDGFGEMGEFGKALLTYTVVSFIVHLAIFFGCRLYNRYWRYATVEDMVPIVLASLFSTVLMIFAYAALYFSHLLPPSFPKSLPILEGFLLFSFASGARFSLRLSMHVLRQSRHKDSDNVLIVGTGETAQALVKELNAHPELGMKPIGFITDDMQRKGLRLLNRPVFGGIEDLPTIILSEDVVRVVIAMPDASGQTIRQVHDLCEKSDTPVKTIPRMGDILEGKVNVSQLRNIELEDLLRREPVQTDIAAVRDLLHGKRVLITGGGGSIGGELCRQVLDCLPSHMALLGHGENSVFDTYNELLERAKRLGSPLNSEQVPVPPPSLKAYIADIRFANRVQNVIREFRPDVIFHAAAHKHVPLMEWNPSEALTNNIFGTRNLLQAAADNGVKHFVMISTDKAVNPTSVMGCSKRVAELVMMHIARKTGNAYVAVRFGNVLGSRGSVVPTFKRQIAAGGPITISHPDMRRFFMTIPEAVQLVLQASVLGKGGEIFMLDMGEAVKIVDLARDLIELSGLEVGHDVEIVYTGVRPGEKLYEELFIEGEEYQPTRHKKILIAKNASSLLPENLETELAHMQEAVRTDSRNKVLACLTALVPEFKPDEARQQKPAPAPVEVAPSRVVSNLLATKEEKAIPLVGSQS